MNNLLDRQGDMMAAAGAAGEAFSRRIGDFADAQAKATGDPAWAEGGVNRAAMQAAGAAIVTGLAGGNAIGGAAGAGIASIAGGKLDELSGAIAGSDPTGNSDMNKALGNIVANAIATGAGGAIGGDAGAFSGYNVDRFNRQLHPDEKSAIKELANGDADKEHRLEAAGCALVHCAAEFAPGTADYAKYSALESEGAGYTTEQAQLKNYNGTLYSGGTYGGMVQRTSGTSLFHYSDSDTQADQRASQIATAALQPGMPSVTFTAGVGGTFVVGYGGSAGTGVYITPASGKTPFDAGFYATYGTGYGFDPSLGGSVGLNKGNAADLRGVASNVNTAVSFADLGIGGSVTYSIGQATGGSYGIGIKGVPSIAGGTASVTNMTTCTFGISNARSGFTQAFCK